MSVWEVAGVWDFAIDGLIASPKVFTGLAGAEDILVIVEDVTLSVSGLRQIQVSVDNGVSYFSASGDYVSLDDNGVLTNTTAFRLHATSSNLLRSGQLMINACNISGIPKPDGNRTESGIKRQFRASLLPINAIQVMASGGGNFTGGRITCLVRR